MSAYTPHRDTAIMDLCINKKVLHIGACDWPYTQEKLDAGNLLYKKIDEVASTQVGVDLDAASASILNEHGFKNSQIIIADMNDMQDIDFEPDIIIFGETLEHLMNLEVALTNLKKVMTPNTLLVISVPNASHFMSFIYALLGYESQHSDHKVAFTYKTLQQLLIANDLLIDKMQFTWLTGSIKTLNWKGKISFYISRPFSRLFPMFAGNLLVSARLNNNL